MSSSSSFFELYHTCLFSSFVHVKTTVNLILNSPGKVQTEIFKFDLMVSGATLYKCINRATATFLAGFLGVGVHWVAGQSGEKFEPIILGSSVFLLGGYNI